PPLTEGGLAAQAGRDAGPQLAVLAVQVEPRILCVLLLREDRNGDAVAVVVVEVTLVVQPDRGGRGALVDGAAADQHCAPATRGAGHGDTRPAEDLIVLVGQVEHGTASAVLDHALSCRRLPASNCTSSFLAEPVHLPGGQVVAD